MYLGIMQSVTFFINILICSKLCLSLPSSSNEMDMIVDVVKSYERPTFVIGKLCWKLSQKEKLIVLLAKMPNPKKIGFVKENEKFPQILIPKDVIIVVDVSCPDIKDFFRLADQKKMFKNPFRWLIVGTPANVVESEIVPSKLMDLNILWDSEVLVLQKNGSCLMLDLVYKIKPNSEWLTEYFGTWFPNSGLHKSRHIMENSFQMRRKNLAKEQIVTSFALTDDRTKYNLHDIRNQVDAMTKCNFHQLGPLYDFMNATRVNIYTNTWGYFVNGSWNGMIQDLISGKADIAGTILYITEKRLEAVNFLASLTQLSILFVFREPPLSYQNNLYLLPFKTTVWYCIAGFVLIVLFILYVNAQWEKKKRNYEKIAEDDAISGLTFNDIAMLVISAISQQGSFVELKGTIGRFVTFILFLSFLFLFTSYSASIVVLLQSSSDQIRTLTDLLHSKLELGVEDTEYNKPYFMTATDPVRKAIYETKVAPRGSKPNFMSLEEGVKKLQKSPFAFYMAAGIGYRVVEKYFQEHEKCGLQEIAYNPPYQTWISNRKDSPHTELFKIGLHRIVENGIARRENLRFLSKKPTCAARGRNFDSVDIMDMYPVLVLLLSGMILAFSLLVIEILLHRRQIKNSRVSRTLTSSDNFLL